jgi:voltage-dependent anion channel protein 2
MPVPAFADIGKATRELLTGSRSEGAFQYDQKVTVSGKTSDGVSLTVTAAKKGGKLVPSVKAAYSVHHLSVDATVDTSDKVQTNLSVNNLTPGLKLSTSILLPDVESAKVTVDYNNPYLSLKGNVGLTSAPKLDAAASTGYKNWILGGDFGYDAKSSSISKWSAGVGYHAGDYQISAAVSDKLGTVKGTVYHSFAPGKAWGAEVSRSLSGSSETTLAVGVSQRLANGNLVKAKVDNSGVASLLYGTKLASGEKVEASFQIDATDLNKPVKTGLSFNLN